MGAPSLDSEFLQYWEKLSIVEKQSLLSVAKNYVYLKEEDADELRKKLIREERENYIKGKGKNLNWEEVKEMAQNKEKRNDLQA